jgi:hypothetical protein
MYVGLEHDDYARSRQGIRRYQDPPDEGVRDVPLQAHSFEARLSQLRTWATWRSLKRRKYKWKERKASSRAERVAISLERGDDLGEYVGYQD